MKSPSLARERQPCSYLSVARREEGEKTSYVLWASHLIVSNEAWAEDVAGYGFPPHSSLCNNCFWHRDLCPHWTTAMHAGEERGKNPHMPEHAIICSKAHRIVVSQGFCGNGNCLRSCVKLKTAWGSRWRKVFQFFILDTDIFNWRTHYRVCDAPFLKQSSKQQAGWETLSREFASYFRNTHPNQHAGIPLKIRRPPISHFRKALLIHHVG